MYSVIYTFQQSIKGLRFMFRCVRCRGFETYAYQKTRANTSDLVELQEQPLGFLVVSTVLIVNLKPGLLRTDRRKYTHGLQQWSEVMLGLHKRSWT